MKKQLPELDLSPSCLFELSYGALKRELLITAIELNAFDRLSEPVTAAEASAQLHTDPGNTEHLLNGLVAMGFLAKTNGRYRNTPVAETFLVNGKDTSMSAPLLFFERWMHPLLNGGMIDLVRNGPPPPADVADPNLWEAGARASLNNARCGRAQRISSLVAALPEFASFSKMLDLGAGPGLIGIAVTAAHPTLQCVLFDQAEVCGVADEVIAEYGMEDRVRTARGDYMADPLGTDFDFVIASYTLNFYRDRLDEITTKVYNALRPGGVYMVVSDGLDKDKTSPATSVISWLSTWFQGMDMSFEKGMIAGAMLRAGFVSTERQTLADVEMEAHGPMEVTIGRKAPVG